MTDEQRDETAEQPSPAESSESPKSGGQSRARKRKNRRKKRPMAESTSVTATPTRHQARILALESLYEHDLTGHDDDEIRARLHEDEDVPPVVRDYAVTLFGGVLKQIETIDVYIGDAAPAFPVGQLSAIDRNVLRIAVYELMAQRKTVPVGVAINEAIEIAKNYGSDNSGKFVHGVLGTIARKLQNDQHGSTSAE